MRGYNEQAVLNLLFGLFASGMIRMRRIDGWWTMPAMKSKAA